ncbi:D-alanyl-D-alanine carboxypeptidase family protein [Absiella sp. AM29-15]|uniref:D-alanyl-D-alanine carboxypeptidase family protein n=1 Tax=Absiella sp. AM29-15 TaxID=2292278 RepID=UPI000E40E22E|nr:serine hydrolase [Absiella sp. AM29-15]RGC52580.1 D-alanyl-D-alanine carboxypeptidase [Absiella sp. AM29-15]
MKKWGCILLCLLIQCSVVHADSYCVLSEDDNTVIEEKDMNEPQSVASISKIMTAMIAIEEGDLKDTWNVGDEIKLANGSSIYLKAGQQVNLQDLLYGLMLRSGNDAAVAIATHVKGNVDDFVKEMNKKARQIGMLNTTFHNPSGLDEEDGGNISTAYDMAILMSYAMKNDDFQKITGAKYYTSTWNYRWKNKNRLLFEFPFTTGGKTGFTKKAGRTLVTTASHDGVNSVVVTLRSSDDFAFHESKHQEVFEKYKTEVLLNKGTYCIGKKQIQVDTDIAVSLQKDGKDTLQVKSHVEKNNFVVEVIKNNVSNVYSYPLQKVKGDQS